MKKRLIRILGIIEMVLGFAGSALGMSLLIYSYPVVLSGHDKAGGHGTTVAVGQAFIITFLPLLIIGILTFRKNRR